VDFWSWDYLPYFPAYKTHSDFFIRSFRKNNDECILILVIYWKKTGLLCTKISNHNIIYSSEKPRKSSSLPLKSSSRLFSFHASLIDVRVFISLEINTYPRRIRRSSNLGHIFRGKSASYRPGNTVTKFGGGGAEQTCSKSNTSVLYYGGAQIEYWPRHRLPWLRFLSLSIIIIIFIVIIITIIIIIINYASQPMILAKKHVS
jgi:hypothetical protein